MQLCANKLDKKDFFGKSDPFLVFYRSNEDGTWVTSDTFLYTHHCSSNTKALGSNPRCMPWRDWCFTDLTSGVKDFYSDLSFICRFTICHKTEVVKNTLNPVWQPFTIPVRALCNGDYDRWGS